MFFDRLALWLTSVSKPETGGREVFLGRKPRSPRELSQKTGWVHHVR